MKPEMLNLLRCLVVLPLCALRQQTHAFGSGMSPRGGVRSALDEVSQSGEFLRVASGYRNFVTDPDTQGSAYPAAKGRYVLFVSYACPWAHRTLITRALKGLESVIEICVVHPTWQKTRNDPQDKHWGWAFADPDGPPLTPGAGVGAIACDGCIPAAQYGFHFIRDIYDKVGDTNGKYSVPILYDTVTQTIVNNESSEIMRMINGPFGKLVDDSDLDLDPPHLQEAQEEVNEWIYTCINNGVYRSGFAQSQAAYDSAVKDVFDGLDRVEELLSRQRYIAGDCFTMADIRLFVTLLRFDEVYVVYFKCNKRTLSSYPHITNYVREIYQMPGVASTCNMRHIKAHYFTSHPTLNHYAVVPVGPDAVSGFEKPHNRENLFPESRKKPKISE